MEKLLQFLESFLSEQRKEAFLQVLSQRTRHFIVAAEDIYQEHNASALVRTCDCFGLQEMHILRKSNTFKIEHGMARGAEKWVDIHIHHADNGVEGFRKRGYQVVATSPYNADCELDDFDYRKKSVFYFGREKEGLSDDILDAADIRMKIPMVGFTESFNISVSVAIVLYELTKKLRRDPTLQWGLSEEEIFRKRIEWSLKSVHHPENLLKLFARENPGVDISWLSGLKK